MDKTEEDAGFGKEFEEEAGKRTAGDAGNCTITGADPANYMFMDPNQLDGIIEKWATEGHSIGQDRENFRAAWTDTRISASDPLSTGYFDAVREVLREFINHNGAMIEYSQEYRRRLAASQQATGAAEQSAESQMTNLYPA